MHSLFAYNIAITMNDTHLKKSEIKIKLHYHDERVTVYNLWLPQHTIINDNACMCVCVNLLFSIPQSRRPVCVSLSPFLLHQVRCSSHTWLFYLNRQKKRKIKKERIMNDVPPVWWNDGTTLIVKLYFTCTHLCIHVYPRI